MPSLPRPIERLASEFDVNFLMDNGLWEVTDPVNGPGTGTWFIQVFRSPLTLPGDLEATQLAYSKTTGRPKFRAADNGAWTDWIDAVAGGGVLLPQHLKDISDISPNKGRLLVGTGETWAAFDSSDFGDFLISDPDATNGLDWFSMSDFALELVSVDTVGAAQEALGLVIGTTIQAFDADLSTIAELAKLKGNILVGNGVQWSVLAAGTAGQYLTPNTGTESGYEWLDLPEGSDVDLSNYFTKEESDIRFQPRSDELIALLTAGFGTDGQVLATAADGNSFEWIDLPDAVDLSNYYTKAESNAAFQVKGDYLVAADLDPYLTSATAATTYQPIGTYLTAADLAPYLTTADAAATYATLASLADYLTTAVAASTYQPLGTYLVDSDLDPYLTSAVAASTYQPIGSYLVADDLVPYLTSASAASTYATIATLTDYLTTADAASTYQPIGSYLVAADLSPYLTSAAAATTYQPVADALTAIAALATSKGSVIVGNGTTWTVVSAGDDDQILIADSSQSAGVKWVDDIATVAFVIDGGGAAITTGIKGDVAVNFSGTIISAQVLADQTGSIVVDLWKDSYANFPPLDADSITASTPLTISSGVKAEDATLDSWVKAITAGDIIRYNVDSNTAINRATVILKIKKSLK